MLTKKGEGVGDVEGEGDGGDECLLCAAEGWKGRLRVR